MEDICDIWLEFEEQMSIEAKFVKALDKIEVRIQHNEADIDTWNDVEFPRSLFSADKYCVFDDFVKKFNDLVTDESRKKIIDESTKDIKEIEKEADQMNDC